VCEHAFVRWSGQLVANDEEQARLPGYRDAVTVRRFDAPEALETRFYEVRAKSVINKVPEASAVPFRWTINPYRGCSHACTYCAWPETPVLMAMAGRAGSPIWSRRRDHGHTRRGQLPALRQDACARPLDDGQAGLRHVLEDGTRLLTSGDHRFLTERGWKHVTGAMSGSERRPYLTPNNALLGTGRFAEGPGAGRRLPPGLPLRAGARRREPRQLRAARRRTRCIGSVSRSPTSRRSVGRAGSSTATDVRDDGVRLRRR
jgi:hypothetical protein